MTDCYLQCNIVKCRKELKTQAWVTICSHVFCMHHGQNAVDKEQCVVCQTAFSNKYDIVIMDLNPPEHHKTMVLAGLSPEKVLDIATRSISYWTYQIYQERLLRDSELRAAKQRSVDITDFCESMSATHKMELQKLQREIQLFKKSIEEKCKQIQDLTYKLNDNNKLIKNLQSKNDSLKRSLATYMRSTENYDHMERMDPDEIRTCNPNYSFNRHNHEDRDRQNYERYSEKSNTDFVFKPMATELSDKCIFKFE